MERLGAREVVELGAAGEPVGQDDRVGPGRPDRGQEVVLGHGDRHLVVALLDAEVPASPQQPPTRVTVAPVAASSAASVSHPMTAWWWQCGCATTSTPLRSGGVHSPAAARSESSSASERTPAATSAARGSSTSWTASSRIEARQLGSRATTGTPLAT